MKILLRVVLMVIFIANLSFALELEEVLKKNYQAIGGLEKILAAKNIAMKGKIKIMPVNMEFPFEWSYKFPDKMKWIVNISGQTMIQALNGNNGWMINPLVDAKKIQPIPDEQLKEMKRMLKMQDILARYKEMNVKLKLLKEDFWEGSEVFIIEALIDDDLRAEIYIDQETCLEIRQLTYSKIEGREITAETILGDYKPVQGLLIPHSIATRSQQGEIEISFSEVQILENIPDQEFSPPVMEKEE